jgi:hypothetical protein
MKKTVIIFLLWGFFISFAFSQNGEHVNGGGFLKRIEYNIYALYTIYNFNSKDDVEKLFFGDFNAPVEFFYNPSFEAYTGGPTGFRITKDSLNTSYILEYKYISNYEKVSREISDKYFGMWEKQKEEEIKLFKVETLSFPVSNQFAEKLYEIMVSFIDNFKSKGIPPIIVDGYIVTFRTVVDDEVWTLTIHEPRGNALKMSDFCRQIMTDIETNTFKEYKYVESLDAISLPIK